MFDIFSDLFENPERRKKFGGVENWTQLKKLSRWDDGVNDDDGVNWNGGFYMLSGKKDSSSHLPESCGMMKMMTTSDLSMTLISSALQVGECKLLKMDG